MRFFLKVALLAGLGLNLLAHSAQAGPFGLFTKSMFCKGYGCCNCERQVNAFTPLGYNPHIHRPVAIGNYSPGCASCDSQPILSGPLQPIPAGAIPAGAIPAGAYPVVPQGQ